MIYLLNSLKTFMFFFSKIYTVLTFAPAISPYQMCRQPFFYLMNSLKRESFPFFFESPNGSSYAYSANGHRFESYQNPLERKQQITDFINCLSYLPARFLWKACANVYEGGLRDGLQKCPALNWKQPRKTTSGKVTNRQMS